MYANSHQPRGFIALMSAVIISAILLVVVVSSSLASINSRFDVLDFESKNRSEALADACYDSLLLKLTTDANYPTSTTMPDTVSLSAPYAGDTCQIVSSTNPGGSPRTFKIQAIYNRAYTDILVSVDVDALVLSSWQEVPHF